MTCIVGYINKKENNVTIAADSAGVGGYQITLRKDVKVFRVSDFVIGCTSSYRMIQLLRYSLVLPKVHQDIDVYQYMCTDFINSIRRTFRDGGFLTIKDNAEGGGTMLVAYKNRLFKICDDYQVGESLEEFSACGCGEAYALGAFKALLGVEISVQEKLQTALKVAEHFSAGVRAPFIFETTTS